MESDKQALFQVFLRLRPPHQGNQLKSAHEPWLLVEPPVESDEDAQDVSPTHITLQPPNDSRKRAVERFGFTKVFEEESSQLDIFEGTGTVEIVNSVLRNGRDGLVATLGVTGSGKSHTIFGSRAQRGVTQMSLDMIYKSIGSKIRHTNQPGFPVDYSLVTSLQSADASEALLCSATSFLESIYGETERGRMSRAQTPMAGGYSRAQTPMTDTYVTPTTRRPPLPRPSTLPQVPDIAQHTIELNDDADYAVIVSMYEVYNDRIFDLLSLSMTPHGSQASTKQGNQLQKDLRRRPLLFKSTEMSPDRKVVAGLRKVVCCSYEEAMMVLETGLTERRVAGTGSNSVSSRSHGFFCIEIKKNLATRKQNSGAWSGGTLSIVDLAGSERARSAKTTGSTLAEAGKINESLMFLGQCLQLQSVVADKPSIVPYRQCKLTELLFSNSFPTSTHGSYRPQKGTMIVTADPHGDFNATSQILRYSALAREVTVPRIPSVTSQILSSASTNRPASRESGRNSPNPEALELALVEIARLSQENDALAIRLAEEEIKSTETTMALRAAEEKALMIEAEVREECWAEMETRIEEEKARYRTAWEQEKLMGEEFLDGKIGILERGGIAIAEDATATTGTDELERENETLQARIAALEREIQTRSPTKNRSKISSSASFSSSSSLSTAKPLSVKENSTYPTAASNTTASSLSSSSSPTKKTNKKKNVPSSSSSAATTNDHGDESTLKLSLANLRLDDIHDAVTTAYAENIAPEDRDSYAGAAGGHQDHTTITTKTPAKKQRKLTTRKWDLGDENEIFD